MIPPTLFSWDPPADDTLGGVDSQCLMETIAAKAEETPEWSIAIPTYRRPALLIETVRSVLAQTDLRNVELLIVDNDPESNGITMLLEALPTLGGMAFRYYRNPENVGMFGNWNACLTLARGTWITVLSDDDLLDPPFVATMRDIVHRDASIQAMVCSYRFLDCRSGGSGDAPVPRRERVRNIFRFGSKNLRRIKVKDMFFGSITGSSLGLVVRRDIALAIGGFRAAEYPSADFYFAARLARRYKFVQSRHALAVTRIAENESARPETLIGFIARQGDLQNALIGREAPAWWRMFQAPSLHLATTQLGQFWQVPLDRVQISQATNHPISPRGARLTRWFRLLTGAI